MNVLSNLQLRTPLCVSSRGRVRRVAAVRACSGPSQKEKISVAGCQQRMMAAAAVLAAPWTALSGAALADAGAGMMAANNSPDVPAWAQFVTNTPFVVWLFPTFIYIAYATIKDERKNVKPPLAAPPPSKPAGFAPPPVAKPATAAPAAAAPSGAEQAEKNAKDAAQWIAKWKASQSAPAPAAKAAAAAPSSSGAEVAEKNAADAAQWIAKWKASKK